MGWAAWLPVGGAAVVLAAAAWLRHRATTGRGGAGSAIPRRGDIWWADVPFADATGAKLRPCLVMRRALRGFVVLKITSQDKSHRRDHIVIPTRGWDPSAHRDSYLNLGEPIVVPRAAFQRRAGRADAATLRRIAEHPGTAALRTRRTAAPTAGGRKAYPPERHRTARRAKDEQRKSRTDGEQRRSRPRDGGRRPRP